jgi:5'-nucleotidase
MSMMQYDLATMGNHDFDNGIDGFYSQLPHAKFDFVSANYDFKNTVLDGIVKPYKIITKDGIKIGIFGLGVELQGLVDKKNYKETVYLDPVEKATEMALLLKTREKCDIVICLSHLGFKYKEEPEKICDILLAQKTKDIDLIIGGHTHTFLSKPVTEKNLDGKQVIINQVGCYGLNLGRIDFYLTQDKKLLSEGLSITV